MNMPIRIATGGGSTTQFLAADGEFRAASASPGGSTTQVQYNNAGAFAGSASFIWTNATGSVTITGASGSAQVIDTGGNGTFSTGDVNSSSNGTRFLLDDSANSITMIVGVGSIQLLAGVVTIGDWAASGNSTTIRLDDANRNVQFSAGAKYISFANDEGLYFMDSNTATFWKWQSVNGVWTGTDTGSATPP